MFFETLDIHQFRNIESMHLKFHPHLNILVGDNGQGKTNILEALCLLSSGESFRFAENINLIRHGQAVARIKGLSKQKDLSYFLQMTLEAHKKNLLVNEKKLSLTQIAAQVGHVLFSPESLNVIKESSDHRRKLVDEILLQTNRSSHTVVTHFRKVLRTRNKVLKNYVDQTQNLQQTQFLLESLEPSFLKAAQDLTYERLKLLREILPFINNAMSYIHQENSVDISVKYLISGEDCFAKTTEEIYGAMYKRLLELRSAELATGHSLIGPHKHDIQFLFGGEDSRTYCSQGQQRTLILSFKIAQIVYHRKVTGTNPILMLDDVLSELDHRKRQQLISFLKEIKAQVFLTTTDLSVPEGFESGDYTLFPIQNGKLN